MEKLNEAIMVLNKSLQVHETSIIGLRAPRLLTIKTGNQHSKHERRTRGANVQELSEQCAVPFRRYVSPGLSFLRAYGESDTPYDNFG